MTDNLKLLFKVAGVPFYKRNSGLFFAAFLFLFGVIPPHLLFTIHKAIINEIISSPKLLSGVVIFWLVYLAQCLNHWLRLIQLKENEFIYNFSLLPLKRQIFSYLLIQLFLFLPVIVYAFVVVTVAFYTQFYGVAFFLVFCIIFINILVTYIIVRRISAPNQEFNNFLNGYLDYKLPKPFPFIFISYLINEDKKMYLTTKLISLLILWGNFFLYESLFHEFRVLLIGFLLSAFTHIILVKELRKFEDTYLQFTRNLPIPVFTRYLYYISLSFLMLFPEILFLISYLGRQLLLIDLVIYLLLSSALCLNFYCFLFLNGISTMKYIKSVFYFFLVLLFSIMYEHAWFYLIGLLLISSFSMLYFNYYDYEVLDAENN